MHRLEYDRNHLESPISELTVDDILANGTVIYRGIKTA